MTTKTKDGAIYAPIDQSDYTVYEPCEIVRAIGSSVWVRFANSPYEYNVTASRLRADNGRPQIEEALTKVRK